MLRVSSESGAGFPSSPLSSREACAGAWATGGVPGGEGLGSSDQRAVPSLCHLIAEKQLPIGGRGGACRACGNSS